MHRTIRQLLPSIIILVGFVSAGPAANPSWPQYRGPGGTGRVDEQKLEATLSEVMDLSPRGIREHLNLNRPIYARTSAYGHFGRPPEADGGFSWEKTDLADTLSGALS